MGIMDKKMEATIKGYIGFRVATQFFRSSWEWESTMFLLVQSLGIRSLKIVWIRV